MARRRSEQLTDDLYQRLSGGDIGPHADEAIVICTVDAAGWPHPAVLSYFEVAAVDQHTLHVAVYTNSRTCANLRERGKATLIIAAADSHRVRAQAAARGPPARVNGARPKKRPPGDKPGGPKSGRPEERSIAS